MVTDLLFVYGTLRSGGENDHYLERAVCVERSCWTAGELHDTGDGYPALKRHPKKRVVGELYVVDAKILAKIDELEDYVVNGDNNLYERIRQTVFGKRQHQAYVYIAGKPLQNLDAEISSGDWFTFSGQDSGKEEGA
ncbi:gamma-glutamylcyclotransferase [Alkalihalobacillus oceani]|uniref:Gamma-glutamylcyclotransferase family protein n=1 Tax=Halalkalibacter oceani TaxID=1653776 RepID=A0A9X2DNH9_9BACI|nr:gamma-glutamylcyclotransferase family protein [Halalkalibacter oceani]MCM3713731.1 gamma-glutamylcyclotransferase [Halalkalibacter oceani]